MGCGQQVAGPSLVVYVHAKPLRLGLALCHPLDCSLPGSSVHGIFQARTLEWVAMSSSRGSSWPRNRTCICHVTWIGRWVFYKNPWWMSHKESTCQSITWGVDLWVGKISCGRKWKPLQCSCLGKLINRGARWALVHGVQRAGHDLVTKG